MAGAQVEADSRADVEAGAAIYSPFLLTLYDLAVVHLSCRYVWRCPSESLVALYDRTVGVHHLDIGPGTGAYLDRCRFPTPAPHITLLDLNPASLRHTAQRIRRYAPRTVQADALQPLPLGGERFDSVGLNFFLHCLPGTMESKARVFDHLRKYLKPGGKVFGSTILGKGVVHNAVGKRLMRAYNQKRVFHNDEDSAEALNAELGRRFPRHNLSLIGTVAVFEAQG